MRIGRKTVSRVGTRVARSLRVLDPFFNKTWQEVGGGDRRNGRNNRRIFPNFLLARHFFFPTASKERSPLKKCKRTMTVRNTPEKLYVAEEETNPTSSESQTEPGTLGYTFVFLSKLLGFIGKHPDGEEPI